MRKQRTLGKKISQILYGLANIFNINIDILHWLIPDMLALAEVGYCVLILKEKCRK